MRWKTVRGVGAILLAAGTLLVPPAPAGDLGPGEKPVPGSTFLREDFNSLDRWKPLEFPKISRHSEYRVTAEEGRSYLRAESSRSASGLILRETFRVDEYPILRWRWRADSVYLKGDAAKKSGDDYPARLYVMFKYDPKTAGAGRRLKYGAAKLLYGEYPPHSALNYIWSNRYDRGETMRNAYAGEAAMIVARGPGDVGSWHEEEIDILADYRRLFGAEPPPVASLAVMNDSDDTGESSVSYFDYIEIASPRAPGAFD